MSYPVFYAEAGDTLPILFDSFDGGTGASATLTGLAVTDIEIYKDGSATQRASDAGYTLLDTDGIDFDGITGIHGFSIDLSDNTDAGFYTVGAWYHVVVSSVTIDAQTVNFIAAAFRIVSATRGMAGTALPDAAADAAGGLPISDNGGLDLDAQIGTDIDAILADTNELQTDDYPTSIAAVKSDTAAILIDTADMQPKLGTPAGASISADIAAIEAQTDDIGIAGAGLTAIPWNAAWDAEVQSEATDALNAYDPPTAAEIPTAAAIADAVWDEASTGHTDAGKAGQQLWTDVDAILADTNELQTDDYPTSIAAVKADTAAILEDTGTTLQAELDGIQADTEDLQTQIGTAGAGLTAINLPDQTMNITGNLSGSVGSVTGAVGSVTGAVGSVTGNLGGNVTGSVGSLAAQAKADVNAEVVDVLRTDTIPDSYAADGAQPTIAQAILAIQQFLQEKAVSGTTVTVKKPDGSTTAMTFTLNDATTPTAITRAS